MWWSAARPVPARRPGPWVLFERLVGAGEPRPARRLDRDPATGPGQPLHVHSREAEAWFLLQGAMTYRAGEEPPDDRR